MKTFIFHGFGGPRVGGGWKHLLFLLLLGEGSRIATRSEHHGAPVRNSTTFRSFQPAPTAIVTGSPPWHRHQRRARARARGRLLRLLRHPCTSRSAKVDSDSDLALLENHHSSPFLREHPSNDMVEQSERPVLERSLECWKGSGEKSGKGEDTRKEEERTSQQGGRPKVSILRHYAGLESLVPRLLRLALLHRSHSSRASWRRWCNRIRSSSRTRLWSY